METTISIPAIPSTGKNDVCRATNPFLRLLGTNELVFLELQGSIARLEESETRLGSLRQDVDGRIYLTVGYQRMEGKVVDLKTPFAVLRRKARERDIVLSEGSDTRKTLEGVVEMEVVDVCRKKIFFGRRPEPMNEMEFDTSISMKE